jgi:hypothetical protein
LVNLPPGDTQGVSGLCLDPHDLAIAKYVARREKNIVFTRALAARGMVKKPKLLELLAKTPIDAKSRERILPLAVSNLGRARKRTNPMNAKRTALCAGWMLTLGLGLAVFADQRQEAPLRAVDLPGTYELVERVYEDGKVLRQPEIAGLFIFIKGRGSLTLFLRNPDSTIGSASLLFRYTLNDEQYCAWIEYTTYNNLGAPGVTNANPPVSSHCSPITKDGDKITFPAPGERVVRTFERNSFVSLYKGQFTDHWRKIN